MVGGAMWGGAGAGKRGLRGNGGVALLYMETSGSSSLVSFPILIFVRVWGPNISVSGAEGGRGPS